MANLQVACILYDMHQQQERYTEEDWLLCFEYRVVEALKGVKVDQQEKQHKMKVVRVIHHRSQYM